MRKKVVGRKFHRKTDVRKAFLRSLARSLILHEKIKTTEARAKEVARFVQKYITKAKKGDLHSIRQIASDFYNDRELVKKLVQDIGKRFQNRKGGYTRVIKLGQRKSDGAKMVIVELLKE